MTEDEAPSVPEPSPEPPPPRNQLRRLRAFVWVIALIGVVQAVGAAFAASSIDEAASVGVQLLVAVGVGLVGASTVAARSRFVRRPWRTDSPASVAIDYSVRVIVQVILALGAANIAYAGAILTGAPWMVVIGLVFFVAPMAAVVPVARNLTRVQGELRAQGCRYELIDCLQPTDTV